jgi:hypothetical protein
MPQFIRGHGGTAIMWHQSLDGAVVPLEVPKSDRLVGIRILAAPIDIVIFSVYLPCRSGCTENFRQVLDELDSAFLLYPQARIILAGDFNADPGLLGGPFGNITNKQGTILGRYLSKWSYISAHLHFQPVLSVNTYESEAHSSSSTIY